MEGLVLFAFLGACTWAALTLPLFRLSERLRLIDDDGGWRVGRVSAVLAASLALSTLVAMALAWISAVALQEPFDGRFAGQSGFWSMMRYRWPSDLLACFLIIAAGTARDYFLRHQSRAAEAATLRAQVVQARLDALRAQLDPHFLFNTLNSVAALARKDPEAGHRMIVLLSDLLRDSLEGRSEPEVTIEREIGMLRRYLQIIEIRFEDRLSTEVRVAPDTEDAVVPSLILQPLVENAMKHGAGRARRGGRIEVRVVREGDELVLQVSDSGADDVDVDADFGAGFGLSQTRERLAQLYGERGRLTLEALPGGGVVAEIRLPFRRAPARAHGSQQPEPRLQVVPSIPRDRKLRATP